MWSIVKVIVSSRPRVVCILHIPEMLRFHHSSHLQVASTPHYEPESILIGYPFKAIISWPRVVLFIYDPESFFPFRALGSGPGVVLLIYDLESFFPFKALSSRPRVIFLIYDPESYLFHLEPWAHDLESFLFHLEPWAHDLESFFSFMTQSHFFSI